MKFNPKTYRRRRRNQLARYFHTQGYGRLSGGFSSRKKEHISMVAKILYITGATIFWGIGLFYLLFN